MTWWLGAALFGLVIGLVAGTKLERRRSSDLEIEHAHMRSTLRHVRGVAVQHPELARLRRYIDRALGDEAGA